MDNNSALSIDIDKKIIHRNDDETTHCGDTKDSLLEVAADFFIDFLEHSHLQPENQENKTSNKDILYKSENFNTVHISNGGDGQVSYNSNLRISSEFCSVSETPEILTAESSTISSTVQNISNYDICSTLDKIFSDTNSEDINSNALYSIKEAITDINFDFASEKGILSSESSMTMISDIKIFPTDVHSNQNLSDIESTEKDIRKTVEHNDYKETFPLEVSNNLDSVHLQESTPKIDLSKIVESTLSLSKEAVTEYIESSEDTDGIFANLEVKCSLSGNENISKFENILNHDSARNSIIDHQYKVTDESISANISPANQNIFSNVCDSSFKCNNTLQDTFVVKRIAKKRFSNSPKIIPTFETKSLDNVGTCSVVAEVSSDSLLEVITHSPKRRKVSSISTKQVALKTFIKPITIAKKSFTEDNSLKSIQKTALKTFPKRVLHGSKSHFAITDSCSAEAMTDKISDSTHSLSPLRELIKPSSHCFCVNEDVLPLHKNQNLICEAKDTINEQILSCKEKATQQHSFILSSETHFRMYCDIHLQRLWQHHCCPKCGMFCTEGQFSLCSNSKGAYHLFHKDCYLISDPGLPPTCPHCCQFSDFKIACLEVTKFKVLNQDNVKMTIKNSVVDTSSTSEMFIFVPNKDNIKLFIDNLSKDNTLQSKLSGDYVLYSIKNGNIDNILHMIISGINPNYKFKSLKNNTLLHVAAFYGSSPIIHILLQCGASINCVNNELETPFFVAVNKNHYREVAYLMQAGAEIDVKNQYGMTAFHVASKNGNKNIAELLYNTGKFPLNVRDDFGCTSLMWACKKTHINYAKWLLDLEADSNIRDNKENTALHWSALTGDENLLELLLDNGCKHSFLNNDGDSALHIAARKDYMSCVALLLIKGACVNIKNKYDKTPLMCCSISSKTYVLLMKHSTTLSSEDGKSKQCLHKDISRGFEIYPIQVINEVDEENFSLDFQYITQSNYAPGLKAIATVDTMHTCKCRDNCTSCYCVCTKMTCCWYDANRTLVSDFDLIDPPTIYECHKLCLCNSVCINRVVQKGLSIPLQIFRTKGKGWGVRTLKNIPKGTFVCEYVGEIITGEEIANRNDDSYVFDLECETGDYCIDAKHFGNVSRYINHNCDPNLISVRVFIEHQDANFPHVAFFSTKDIIELEELCFDYGMNFWMVKGKMTLCACNSHNCKYSKDSFDDTFDLYMN